jgi:DNA-binding beta-propeller fold protein YncE
MANDKDFKVKNGIQPTVYHEGVGTVVSGSVGYYLAGASYDNKSFTPSPAINSLGVAFKTDGTKMYTLDLNGDDVAQYSLTSAWDVSTATYDSKTFDVGSQDTDPYEVAFKSDGTKMYILGTANDTLYQYSLSTAWDVSTASYDSVSFSFTSQTLQPYGMSFSPDGTKLYVADQQNSKILQYTLSTAWDASTISYASKFLDVSGEQGNSIYGVAISYDGSYIYSGTQSTGVVYQYKLSTAFDVSTGSYTNVSVSTSSQEAAPTSIEFDTSGNSMFITGFNSDTIYQYSTALNTASLDLSSGSVFEITPTSDIQVGLSNPAASGTVSQATLLLDGGGTTGYDISNASYDSVSFSVASQDNNPRSLLFNSNGTKAYLLGDSNNSVFQYTLSAAFDISTMSYDSVSFSLFSQGENPSDASFNSNGTKFYYLDFSTESIFQYSLSTAYDISTLSYDSVSFSVTSQEGSPRSFILSSDGTKFYMIGSDNDTIYQYSMSTAYDLSTASYTNKSFSVNSQETTTLSIVFNNDGTKLYMVGVNNDTIFQYSLSTAYDISTASYDSVSFSVLSEDTQPYDITFNNDGTKLYMVGSDNDTIYQYSTVTPATITYPSTLEFSGGTAPTSPAIGETDVITFSTTDGGTSYQAVQAIDGAK